jgi:HlyD family secretion protein
MLPLIVIGIMIAAGVAAVALIFAFGFRFGIKERYTGPTAPVTFEILKVTIVERGALESAENSDIVVRVKAGSKGSTIASTIKWVIDDGTQVKAGDPIVELDDSGFQETLKTQKNTVNKATSDWIDAKSKVAIAVSQNESDIKSAEVLLNLAELDLRKYVGTIPALTIFKIPTRDALQKYLMLPRNSAARTN